MIRLPISHRILWLLLACGVSILSIGWLMEWHTPLQALSSYLFAFVFFTGLSLGSLALIMVHALTGGAWGIHIRPALLAGARTLPLQAILALPLLFGAGVLYPWAKPAVLAHDALLRSQSWYLNRSFFVGRTVGYFAIWLLFLMLLRRRLEDPARLPRLAAGGLIVYLLSATLAAVDWIMSLLPHWHSSVFGLLLATDWVWSATAFATLYAVFLKPAIPAVPRRLPDLGNLLLVMVLLGSYLAFMQYLTIWSADLPAETCWYLPRAASGWREMSCALIACQCFIPFVVLLSHVAKRSRAWLGCIALLLLIAHLANASWLVLPNIRARGFSVYWSDLLAPLGMGALWIGIYLWNLPASAEPARD
jgi:hypothetical protein